MIFFIIEKVLKALLLGNWLCSTCSLVLAISSGLVTIAEMTLAVTPDIPFTNTDCQLGVKIATYFSRLGTIG
jgi:hypothetical protein